MKLNEQTRNRVSLPTPRGLIFTWAWKDAAKVRLGFAVFFAAVCLAMAWLGLRVVVPVSMAEDAPQVGAAKLILLREEDDLGLGAWLSSQNLPTLGGEPTDNEVPLVQDTLALLGLSEEPSQALELYPSPELREPFRWPEMTEGKGTLTLPELPELPEILLPPHRRVESVMWSLEITPQGLLGDLFTPQVLAWQEGEVAALDSTWTVGFDGEGVLQFAIPLGEVPETIEGLVRGYLERLWGKASPDRRGLAGKVKITLVGREKEDDV